VPIYQTNTPVKECAHFCNLVRKKRLYTQTHTHNCLK